MNILLVRGKPTFMDFIIGIPIGLVYIAPLVRQDGHYVEVLDLALEEDPEESLRRKLQERQWNLAGFTCMTAEWDGAVNAARQLKEYDPNIRTIFGGQHPTIEPEQVLSNEFADIVCIGEGEETFRELVECLARENDISSVQGIACKKSTDEVVRTPPRPPIQDVDSIPIPAYDLLDLDRYAVAESARHTTKYQRAIQIFTSRGCPWHCVYCHDLFGKKFRPRSAAHVLEEMKLLYEQYQIQEFMIEDDIFNFDMDRAKDICDRIVASGMEISMQFGNGVRLERLDEELIQKMAAAGTHHMCIAIESASPRVQKLSRKYLKLHMVKDVVSWTRKHGIETLGFFMIGFPTETVEEINMTIRFACETDLDEALFSIVIPYAGTELSRQVAKERLYDPDEEEEHLNHVHRIKTQEFDFRTLKRLQRKAYFLFFLSRFRFVRMLPRLMSVRSSMKYLRALERNFLPEFLQRQTSRIN